MIIEWCVNVCGHLGWFYLLLIVNSDAMNWVCEYLCETLLLILLDMCLYAEVVLLDRMVVLF